MSTLPRIFARTFWGFDPEREAYIGFTEEWRRAYVLSNSEPGDLVLIYGATNENTHPDQVGMVLGFLELTDEVSSAREFSDPAKYQERIDNGQGNRWTHAIRISRAWRCQQKIPVRDVSRELFDNKHQFQRSSGAYQLNDQDAQRAASIRVQEVSVWGSKDNFKETVSNLALVDLLKPSRGVSPGASETLAHTRDFNAKHHVYLAQLQGDVSAVMEGPPAAIFKVGLTNNLMRRENELNAGFPMPHVLSWSMLQHLDVPNRDAAEEMEQALKDFFVAQRLRSLGREFFAGRPEVVKAAFSKFEIEQSHVFKGIPSKARGLR